jgi:hypothetical protein
MDYTIASGVTAIGSGDVAPVSGTKGEFTSGNPGITPATVLPGYQMNAIVEELLNVVVAAGVTPSNTNNAQLLQALRTLFRGENIVKFSTTGANNWTCPAGVYFVKYRIWGAGGGGGGALSGGGGGGGGGGAFSEGITAVTPGTVYVMTIGAGGAAGSNAGGPGSTGGTTSFGSFATCTGGLGGGGVGTGGGAGGVGGAASGGTVNFPGEIASNGSAVGVGGQAGGTFGFGTTANIGNGTGGVFGPIGTGGNGGGGSGYAGATGAPGYGILEF